MSIRERAVDFAADWMRRHPEHGFWPEVMAAFATAEVEAIDAVKVEPGVLAAHFLMEMDRRKSTGEYNESDPTKLRRAAMAAACRTLGIPIKGDG